MSFVAELNFTDLQRLRSIIKKVHFRYYPTEFCTDQEADRQIEALGPEVQQKILKRYIDAGLVQ